MNDPKSRFKELLFKRGLSQTELAQKVGKSKQAVSTWSRGTLPRDEETLTRLCQILGTTPAFLRYGTELKDGTKQPDAAKDKVMIHVLYDPDHPITPLVEVIQVSVEWIRSYVPEAPLDQLRLHIVRGDSMAPTAKAGDLLIVDTSATVFDADDLYLLQDKNGLFVFKRVQSIGEGFSIISDNPRYQAFQVPSLDNYKIIGKVKVVGHFSAPA